MMVKHGAGKITSTDEKVSVKSDELPTPEQDAKDSTKEEDERE